MRVIKKILGALLVVIVLLLVISLFLPSTWRVERSAMVQAPPEAVFPLLSDLRRWQEWTVWTVAKDPTLKNEYEGPPAGTGAKMTWKGDKMRTGELVLTSSDPQKGIAYDISFDGGQHRGNGTIALEPAAGGTKVIWTGTGDVGMNPVGRYFALLMDRFFLGADFEEGLANLKKKAEEQKK